jgi:DNA polymerase-4
MQDLTTQDECELVIETLYQKLLTRLAPHSNREIIKQGVKLKFSDFNQTTVETQSNECQQALFSSLLSKAYNRSNKRGIRLVGLTLGFADTPSETNQLQLSL